MKTNKEYFKLLNMKGDLPKDCNDAAIKHAQIYNSDTLIKMMLLNQKKKFHGQTKWPAHSEKLVEYNFTNGICVKAVATMFYEDVETTGTVLFYDTSTSKIKDAISLLNGFYKAFLKGYDLNKFYVDNQKKIHEIVS